jgi:hypothetical protein
MTEKVKYKGAVVTVFLGPMSTKRLGLDNVGNQMKASHALQSCELRGNICIAQTPSFI